MMGTPIYTETFQDHVNAAIDDADPGDSDGLLDRLEQMDRDTTPKEKV